MDSNPQSCGNAGASLSMGMITRVTAHCEPSTPIPPASVMRKRGLSRVQLLAGDHTTGTWQSGASEYRRTPQPESLVSRPGPSAGTWPSMDHRNLVTTQRRDPGPLTSVQTERRRAEAAEGVWKGRAGPFRAQTQRKLVARANAESRATAGPLGGRREDRRSPGGTSPATHLIK